MGKYRPRKGHIVVTLSGGWLFWALLSAVFAAATALLAKVGIAGIDSNLATAIRTTVVFVFAWVIALSLGHHHALAMIGRRSWIFWCFRGWQQGCRGYATSARCS